MFFVVFLVLNNPISALDTLGAGAAATTPAEMNLWDHSEVGFRPKQRLMRAGIESGRETAAAAAALRSHKTGHPGYVSHNTPG